MAANICVRLVIASFPDVIPSTQLRDVNVNSWTLFTFACRPDYYRRCKVSAINITTKRHEMGQGANGLENMADLLIG